MYSLLERPLKNVAKLTKKVHQSSEGARKTNYCSVKESKYNTGPFFTKCALEKFDTYIFLARWLFSNESWCWVMGDTDKRHSILI